MKRVLLNFICMVLLLDVSNAFGITISGDHYTDIHVNTNMVIENNGHIYGDIYFDGGYNLTIVNHGDIIGQFFTVPGATVMQSVDSADDINIINNLIGHTIDVYHAGNLNMADLIAISGNASEIVINDSTLVIDRYIPNENPPIHLNNSVSIRINGSCLVESGTVLENINGVPNVEIFGADPMYIATGYPDGDKLNVKLARQTNYSIVFGGALGNYLDSLRDANARDKLISNLDRAGNRRELNHILNNSAHVHPVLLATPIKIFNTMDDMLIFNDTDALASISPLYITSDDFSMWGGKLNVSGMVHDNIFARLGVYGGMLNYDGKFDEYNSTLYGGNFDVAYVDKDFYVGTYGKLSYAQFNDIDVLHNGKVTKDPHGIVGQFGFDSGPIFGVLSDVRIAPFVGGIIDYANVLNDTDTDFNARAGVEATVDTVQDGNKYMVGMRAFIQTDGGIYAMLRSNMLSIADGVGGGINLGVLYNDSVVSYKIGLDINFLF